ncbi:hypothetical protein DdX_06130 [Ditylenchus destructor]|uniref:Uncharacterized protein n=1 Tax=Ditylenchus destructor TaxID=166010 RepID=A0AAD4N5N6_9BILA|nr:hypothetical protein DdX_06130 [Ditylenchus destructor]
MYGQKSLIPFECPRDGVEHEMVEQLLAVRCSIPIQIVCQPVYQCPNLTTFFLLKRGANNHLFSRADEHRYGNNKPTKNDEEKVVHVSFVGRDRDLMVTLMGTLIRYSHSADQ